MLEQRCSKRRGLRANNLGVDTLASKQSPVWPRATNAAGPSPPQQAAGLSRRAGANAPPNTKSRVPAAPRAPADATAADGRASRPTRLREPTARGAARRKLPKDKNKQPKKLFETLAARPDAVSLAQAAQKDSDHCGA